MVDAAVSAAATATGKMADQKTDTLETRGEETGQDGLRKTDDLREKSSMERMEIADNEKMPLIGDSSGRGGQEDNGQEPDGQPDQGKKKKKVG